MLELNELICICVIVMTAFSVTEGVCKRLGLRPFDLMFPAILVLALKWFTIRVFPEFCVNAATFMLPAALLMMGLTNKSSRDKNGMYSLFIGSIIPIFYEMVVCLFDLTTTGYGAFDLSAARTLDAQTAICALTAAVEYTLSSLIHKRTRAV